MKRPFSFGRIGLFATTEHLCIENVAAGSSSHQFRALLPCQFEMNWHAHMIKSDVTQLLLHVFVGGT